MKIQCTLREFYEMINTIQSNECVSCIFEDMCKEENCTDFLIDNAEIVKEGM